MIFILDIILLFNIILAYRKFKVIVAPPVLLGGGMLIASLVATTYYEEWEMGEMLLESVLILGGNTCLFTFVCYFIKGNSRVKWGSVEKDFFRHLRINLVYRFTVFLVLLGMFCCIMKMKSYMAYYGTFFDYSELINEVRSDTWEGNKGFSMPRYIIWISFVENFYSYFSAWILSYLILEKKEKKIQFLLLLQYVVLIVSGGIEGAKGLMFEPICRFGVTFILLFYYKKKSFSLPKKFVMIAISVFLTVMFSFSFISNIIGRDHGVLEGNELFAIYIGGEIKNFDIYMHGNDGNPPNKVWGENTFFILYKEFHPKYKNAMGNLNFQGIGTHPLGNVYTQFYSFHKDFGIFGTIVMTILIAALSMFFYKKSLYRIAKSASPNIYSFIYITMSFHIFMSFFSCKFCENILQVHFCKVVLCLGVCLFIFNQLFYSKTNRIQRTIIKESEYERENLSLLPQA